MISEDLLNKLISIYEQSSSFQSLEEQSEEDFIKAMSLKKIFFTVEGTDMTNEFDEYLNGDKLHTNMKQKKVDEEEESEDETINYENSLTKHLRISTEPRLFPLYVNGSVINYNFEVDETEKDEQQQQVLRLRVELAQTNEIHNFHQGMLSAAGIYLLDFESEAFIWIGKLVPKQK